MNSKSKMAQGGLWLAACLSSWAGVAMASDPGMPECAGVAGVRVVHEGLGAMESAAFLPSGKLVFSQPFRSKLMRKDSLSAQPVEVASGISMPGGIVARELPAFRVEPSHQDRFEQHALRWLPVHPAIELHPCGQL